MKNSVVCAVLPSMTAVLGASLAHCYHVRNAVEMRTDVHKLSEVFASGCATAGLSHACEPVQRRDGVFCRHIEEMDRNMSHRLVLEREAALMERDIAILNRNKAYMEGSLALSERDRALNQFQFIENEKQHALNQLHAAESENGKLNRAVRNAQEELAKSTEREQLSQHELRCAQEDFQALQDENQNLWDLTVRKSEVVNSHIETISNLNEYICQISQSNLTVESLRQELDLEKSKVVQQQAQLEAFENYVREKEHEHRKQLEWCEQHIEALHQQRQETGTAVASFLGKHPELEIDIALMMKADRVQAAASPGSSSASHFGFNI